MSKGGLGLYGHGFLGIWRSELPCRLGYSIAGMYWDGFFVFLSANLLNSLCRVDFGKLSVRDDNDDW